MPEASRVLGRVRARRELGGHVSEHELDSLVLADGLAESLALLAVPVLLL